MKKDLLIKGLLYPLCIGVALGLAFFLYSLSAGDLLVVNEQNAIAYFDSDKKEENQNSENEFELKKGQVLATAKFGKNSMDVVFDADYSDLDDSISFVKGSLFGNAGFGYCYSLENNIKDFDKKEIILSTSNGEYKYAYHSSFSTKNENDVFLHKLPKGRGFVLYYQKAGSYGFSSDYEALVYKEVA